MTKRNVWRRIGDIVKIYYKPFLFLFCLYLLGLITLLRDHYTFTDDLYRAIYGGAWSDDFGRFSSSFLSFFLNQSFGLFDISPIPQIVAMGMMSISSLLLIYLFVGKPTKIKDFFWPLVLSVLIGLSPFMMNAWMYKFDAPCMALGILVSILPYVLVWNKRFVEDFSEPKRFAMGLFVTMVLLIVMWSSFQAASGIFLVLGLAMIFRNWIIGKKNNLLQVGSFIFSYIMAGLVFYLIIKDGDFYREITTFGFNEIFSGVWGNICLVAGMVANSMKVYWWILVGTLIISLSIFCWLKKEGYKRVLLAFGFLVLSLPVSLGAYIALMEFPINGRSLVGLCFSFTIFLLLLGGSIWTEKMRKGEAIVCVAMVLLLYSFMTFSWSFGNALNDQYRYDEFLSNMIAKDLGDIYKTRAEIDETAFIIKGEGGLSTVMVNHFDSFPVAKYVFFESQTGVNRDPLGYYRVFDYHNYPADWYQSVVDGYYEAEGETEVLRDNYYYQIKRMDETNLDKRLIIIELKRQARPLKYDDVEVFFGQIGE